MRVVDLGVDAVLDALGLDARVASSHEPQVRQVCWQLTDRVIDWWGEDVDGIAYPARTTPQRSTNVALFAHAGLAAEASRLGRRTDYLDTLIAAHGFTVDFDYPIP